MWRNILLFAVLAITVIVGWYWLVLNYGTRPDPDQIAKIKDKKPPEKKDVKKDAPEKKPIAQPEQKVEIKQPAKEEPPKTDSLGGPGFHLTVDTISRGAGVRRVALNRFKAANWRGEPTDRDLELIQDDEFKPSFRMYHFLDADDKKPPVFGLGEKVWTVEKKKERVKDKDDNILHDEITYATTIPDIEHIKVIKTFRLAPKDYHVTMLLELLDLGTGPQGKIIPLRYQLTGGMGLPIEGEWYTATFRNAIIGVLEPNKNLWRTLEESARISLRQGGDRIPEGQLGGNLLQYAGVCNQYFGSMLVVDPKQPSEDGVKPETILAWARPTLETHEKRGLFQRVQDDKVLLRDLEGKDEWFQLLPRTSQHIEDLQLAKDNRVVLSYYERPDEKLRVASWVRIGETLKPQFDDITVRVNSEVIPMGPRDRRVHQFMLYHGPVKAALLGQFSGDKEVAAETVDRYVDELHLRTLTDYRSDNWFGRVSSWIKLTDIIILFTRLMHWLLYVLQSIFGGGFSIVVLTVIVRGAMFPISRKQALFSIKMQELAPELKKISDRYPDDPQARMQATAEFNRKHGINPLASCWPLLLQMPIFLGLYFSLQESIHFRLASFLWIESLAAPDMLVFWTENIPVISQPDAGNGFLGFLYLGPYLNVLPVFAVVFMLIQQIQTMPPPTDDQQATQQKMIKIMSVVFGIMFYKVAAGLCIYFITSSLWGMAERMLLPKKKPAPDGAASPTGTPASSSTAVTASPPKYKVKQSKKDKEKAKEQDNQPITTIGKLKALWHEILKQAEKK